MGLEERPHCRTATMLPWTDSPGCASWRPAWDSPPASPPISEKVEQAVCPPGIRAERIRADIGFEAASPFPAAGGISLPCLRLPPPRVSGQGAPFPQSPATPLNRPSAPWALCPICLTNLTFCKKVQGSMPGRSCFPLVLFRWMWYDTIKPNHKICLYFARG